VVVCFPSFCKPNADVEKAISNRQKKVVDTDLAIDFFMAVLMVNWLL
jgi:hypothetical protein